MLHLVNMDPKRKVTVLDLESDGFAAVDERRRKADAAAEKKFNEVQRDVETKESLTSPPLMESEKTKVVADSGCIQSFRQTEAQGPRINPQKEHDESVGEDLMFGEKHSCSKARSSDQDISQRHVSSCEQEEEFVVSHPTPGPLEKSETPSGTRFDVPSAKTPNKCGKHSGKRKVLKVEYTPAPPPPTEITGSYVFDEFNKFMDDWLVPDEISFQMRGNGTIVPLGDTHGCAARDAQVVQVPSSQPITSTNTGNDCKPCFTTCYGCSGARGSAACPTCNQPVGGAEEPRSPSLSRRWTRWIFRQCEEPLDIEAEFLVTPRARLAHSVERDGGCYRRVINPYQTRILGITQ